MWIVNGMYMVYKMLTDFPSGCAYGEDKVAAKHERVVCGSAPIHKRHVHHSAQSSIHMDVIQLFVHALSMLIEIQIA